MIAIAVLRKVRYSSNALRGPMPNALRGPMPCAGQCPARANALFAQEHLLLLRKAICYLMLLTAFPRSEETAQISTALISAWNTSYFQDE